MRPRRAPGTLTTALSVAVLPTQVPSGVVGWVFELSDRTVEDVVLVDGDAALDEAFGDGRTIGVLFGQNPLAPGETRSARLSVTFGPAP